MGSPTDIRKGKVITYEGRACLVLDAQHRTQGRQAGFMQVKLRDLSRGSTSDVKFRSTDSIDFCHTESRSLEYTYVDESGYHFMDPETYEDMVLSADLVEDSKQFLVSNGVYSILFVEDKPLQIQLPASVDMKVVEAPEAIKGNSAGNVMKPIITESGITVHVPLFIGVGEKIKISTQDLSYLGRA